MTQVNLVAWVWHGEWVTIRHSFEHHTNVAACQGLRDHNSKYTIYVNGTEPATSMLLIAQHVCSLIPLECHKLCMSSWWRSVQAGVVDFSANCNAACDRKHQAIWKYVFHKWPHLLHIPPPFISVLNWTHLMMRRQLFLVKPCKWLLCYFLMRYCEILRDVLVLKVNHLLSPKI